MALTYKELKQWLSTFPGIVDPTVANSLQTVFFPGPASNEEAYDQPGRTVVLTLGGGPGFELEQQYDRVQLYVDVAGNPNDLDDAEKLALAVDKAITSVVTPTVLTQGGTRALSFQRSGGRPTLVTVDDGDRSHFTCGYVLRVES